MADYTRVVEYLRDIRTSPVQSVSDELRLYATEYAELCRQANDRLRQCSQFLQQGLRSEAIHLANEPPNLLEMVAALDLPDPEVWADICQQWDLPLPPPLQMDRATQLNDAYAADASLEDLLRRHRLLALSRAALRKRLEVMRQIAAQDPGSTFWEKDIRGFEKARIKEMRTETSAAIRNQDVAAIAGLAAEIDNNTWLEPVPADLQKAVSDTFNSMLRAEVEGNVQGVLKQLRAAYAAKDHAQCEQLLQQCRAMFDAANQTAMSSHIASELQPIVAWVQRENEAKARRDAFERRCQKFAAALEADVPTPQLEAAYLKVKDGDQPPPQELVERYHARLAQRALAAGRRQRLRILALVAIVLLAIGGGYFFIQMRSAGHWARLIREANAARNLDEANRRIEQQEKRAPRLNTDAAIVAAKAQTRDLQAQHDRDVATLKAVLDEAAAARSAAQRTLAAGDIDQVGPAASALGVQVEKLRAQGELAWVDTQGQIPAIIGELSGLQSQMQQKIADFTTTGVMNELAELTRQADAIPADAAADKVDEVIGQLSAIAGKARVLGARPGLADETRAAIAALATRLDERKEVLEQTRARQAEIDAIIAKAGSTDGLKAALEAFVARFPNDPSSRDFQAAAANIALAQSVEAWRALAGQWQGKFTVDTATAANQRIETIQGYLTAYPQSPLTAQATAYMNYLRAAADVLADKGVWQTSLSPVLATPMLSELSYMESSDGRRYYTLGEINQKRSGVNGRVTVTFEALDPRNITKRRTVTVAPPLTVTTTQPVLAPHARVANEINDSMKLIDEDNWHAWGIDLIERLVGDNQIEPVVKAILLQQVLKINEQVLGPALGTAFEKAQRDLARLQPETIVWYDPDRPVSEITRLALSKAIGSIPPARQLKEDLAARRAALFKSLSLSYSGTGVLLRDASGTLVVHAPGAADAVAWAIAPQNGAATTPSGASLVAVAQYKDDKWQVNEAAVRGLPEGSLLLVGRP